MDSQMLFDVWKGKGEEIHLPQLRVLSMGRVRMLALSLWVWWCSGGWGGVRGGVMIRYGMINLFSCPSAHSR